MSESLAGAHAGSEEALIHVWSIMSDMDVVENMQLAAGCMDLNHDDADREAREWDELLQGITTGAWQSWHKATQGDSDSDSIFSCEQGLEFDSGQLMLVANGHASGSWHRA